MISSLHQVVEAVGKRPSAVRQAHGPEQSRRTVLPSSALLNAIQASPSGDPSANALGLARADAFAVEGKSLESLIEVTRVYEAGAKAFEDVKK